MCANEGRTLLVKGDGRLTAVNLHAECDDLLAHQNGSEDREDERAPVHEHVAGLVDKDRPEVPGDGDAGWEVTLGGRHGVRGGGGLEEE